MAVKLVAGLLKDYDRDPIIEPPSARVFGLACKAAAGMGNDDFAYSPPVGNRFRLLNVSLWYGNGDPNNYVGGTIYISSGTEIPTREIVATNWEIVLPFWAGTTKPAIMLWGPGGFLTWRMNRLYTTTSLRFGMAIENGSGAKPFWVNSWFEIAEV